MRNFFSNLDDVTVLANDILQLKLEQTTRDFMRLMFNSTFGMFGLLDVASRNGPA
jgi:phospholipid-binding lipoprotein MlaA